MHIVWDMECTCSFKPRVAQSIIKEKDKNKLKIVALQIFKKQQYFMVNLMNNNCLELVLQCQPKNLSAENEGILQEKKDGFYDSVDSTLFTLPQYRIRIVLGNLNANIFKEAMFRPNIGNHSLYKITNNNGLKLIDFACKNVSTRFKNRIQEVRTIKGADVDSDHYLDKRKLRVKIKKVTHKKGIVIFKTKKFEYLWKIQTSDVGKIRRIDTDINESIDSTWKKIKDTIKVVIESEVGKLKTARKP
ncbi:hypothetical protein AGLY_006594 [Aphis glycines]|uniref:Endonuclease/exonuclease/phosphatase domain-containing protein n=1 Tax=Aphis glycines TaxID=307491 RepID=A0A6G0TTU3_APHGL|nr:hypothetical protein AGLY_006594 [Aphis glycines]